MITGGVEVVVQNLQSSKESIGSFPINPLQALNAKVSFNQFTQMQLSRGVFSPNFVQYISNQTQVIFYHLAKFNFSLVLFSINSQVNYVVECAQCASIIGFMENSKLFKDVVLETGISSGYVSTLVSDSHAACESFKFSNFHVSSMNHALDPLVPLLFLSPCIVLDDLPQVQKILKI